MAKLMSKSELIQKIAEQHSNNMTRKDVKGVIESLAKIGYMELKKSGAFLVPGFAKFVVIKKPAINRPPYRSCPGRRSPYPFLPSFTGPTSVAQVPAPSRMSARYPMTRIAWRPVLP